MEVNHGKVIDARARGNTSLLRASCCELGNTNANVSHATKYQSTSRSTQRALRGTSVAGARTQVPCGGTLSKLACPYTAGNQRVERDQRIIFTSKRDRDNTRDKLGRIGNRDTIDRFLPQLEVFTRRHAANTPLGRLAPCAAEALGENKDAAGSPPTEQKFDCRAASTNTKARGTTRERRELRLRSNEREE